MHKTMNRIKSLVLGGAVAVSSLAAPLSSNVAKPSLSATAAGSDDYAKLLQYSLYLYDANMCGSDVGEKSGLTWRDDCHTSDEVQGGYHDAGDHAMFGLPQGYTASSLGWSYYEFKDAYNETGQAEHIKVILDRFCEFFKDSTQLNGNNVSRFLYQKGDGDVDHKYWGPPENQGGSRKMFWTSGGASDIAADYAAALALNYLNFGNAEDLKYAEALYNFSTQHNAVATDGPNNFYKSSGCQDEQANAAGWLYLATKNEKYKNDCASKQVQYIGWVDGWDNRGLGAACVYAHITGDWGKVNNYISGKATGSNYLFMDKWGSARLNTTMQFCALVASKNSNRDFKSWAKGQMNYILGDNPANTCFVVGFASNSAKNPHHRAASGYTSYEQFDMNNWNPDGNHMQPFSQVSSNGHTLVGALVGGPCDAGGTYHDNMGDYICNEVAIDYNAGFVGAAAGLYYFYGTGSTVSSIEGVDKIYSGSVTPGPGTTTTTSKNPSVITTTTVNPSTGGDTVLLPSDMVVDTEIGDDGEINNYAEFAPGDAKTATLYYTVNSTDTESSGAFGTWTGKWEQEDFKVNVKNGKVEVTYEIPSNVGSTVKAMVFWPHGNAVTIDKVVLSSGSTPSVNTTTTKKTTTRTTTTTAKTPSSGGNDIVLTPSDMTVDTEEGDDGGINNFAEFAHQGASSCTLYYTVNTSDTESSGGFGTWNGEWVQEDFKVNVKNGKVEVSYDIPSNAGSTIKAMIWWPHDNGVTIDKVVLHFDKANTTTTTSRTTTSRTTTTRTTSTTTKPGPSKNVDGDANCDGVVRLNDAILILQYLGDQERNPISSQGIANADCCNPGDGLTNKDALSIQKYLLGLITSLPEYS